MRALARSAVLPLVIGGVPGIRDFDQPAPCALGGDFGLKRGIAAAGVAVDHRNPAGGLRQSSMIGCASYAGIHEVVEPHDALFAGPGERDGDLAVMGGSGGEDRGDGDDAVGGIEMRACSRSRFSLNPLLLRLTPTSHWVGNPARISSSDCVRCCSMRVSGLGRQHFILARTPTLALGQLRAVASRPGIGGRVFHALRSPWRRARYDL